MITSLANGYWLINHNYLCSYSHLYNLICQTHILLYLTPISQLFFKSIQDQSLQKLCNRPSAKTCAQTIFCPQTYQLEKSQVHFEKNPENVCPCDIHIISYYLQTISMGWQAVLQSTHSIFKGPVTENILQDSQSSINFARETKQDATALIKLKQISQQCARWVPAASPPNRPATVLCTILRILRNPLKTTCLLQLPLSYLLTFLR